MEDKQDERGSATNPVDGSASGPGTSAGLSAAQEDIIAAIHRKDFCQAAVLSARAHGQAIGRFCMAMVGSQADADTLAQETFITAWETFGSYRPQSTVRCFLFGIARRLCAKHIETSGRRQENLKSMQGIEEPSPPVASHAQSAQRTRDALDSLRPTEREAVVLRFQSDLSFQDLADACGIDEATARTRVSRAIANLRQAMSKL